MSCIGIGFLAFGGGVLGRWRLKERRTRPIIADGGKLLCELSIDRAESTMSFLRFAFLVAISGGMRILLVLFCDFSYSNGFRKCARHFASYTTNENPRDRCACFSCRGRWDCHRGHQGPRLLDEQPVACSQETRRQQVRPRASQPYNHVRGIFRTR